MSDQSETLDLLWGAAAIGAFIGRTTRQAWEALDKGELPARKVNGRWCASKARLTAFFTGGDVGEAHSASPAPAPSPAISVPPTAAPRRKPTKPQAATIHRLLPRKGRAA